MAAEAEREVRRKFDVFLSHNSVDKPWVSELKGRLEARRLVVWLDRDEIRPGDHFVDALEKGLAQSKAMVLVVSPEAMQSGWVKEEYNRAISLAQDWESEFRLIPVILRQAALPGFLRGRHWVDFRDESKYDDSLDNLIWGITGKKSKKKQTRRKSTKKNAKAKRARTASADPAGNATAVRGDSGGDAASATLTWLQLSDFHFREGGNWQQDVVLRSLVRDVIGKLPESGLVPELVFVTGDVAFSGKAGEYETARAFFDELRKGLRNVPKEHWFVVPGNHDVDRTAVNPLFKGMRDTINVSNVGDILASADSWSSFASRQKAFFRFTSDFLGPSRAWKDAAPWKVEFAHAGRLTIAVLCLNSAWACQDGEDAGNILIGEYQLRKALEAADREKPDLKIALVHHPLSDLKPFDEKSSGEILFNRHGCHVVLRGHLHEVNLGGFVNPSGTAFEFASGACWQDAGHPHSVLAVQLDLVSRQVTVHAWTYSPKRGGFWAPDNHLYPGMDNGRWTFALPEEWGLRSATTGDGPGTGVSGPLIPAVYRQFLRSEFSDAENRAGRDSTQVFHLQEVYVPLQTDWVEPEMKKQQRRKDGKRGADGAPLLGGEGRSPRRPLADLLGHAKHRHFLVTGDPGSGKSTFIRFSALSELDCDPPRLPLPLQLQDFGNWLARHPEAEKDGGLLCDWAGQSLASRGLNAETLRARSGEGRQLWLLDGLDEIFDTALRLRAARIIGEWFGSESGRGDRLVITTRPHALEQEGITKALGLRDTRADIRPLSRADQQAYLERWFCALFPDDAEDKAGNLQRQLWEAMEQNARLEELRDNPLMLSTIAVMYLQGRILPERRADLYGKTVDVLLNKAFGPLAGGSDVRVRKVRRGIIEVARRMHERKQVREISEHEFLGILETSFYPDRSSTPDEKVELEGFARDLGCHSGLLNMHGAPPLYRFYHLGFQEYLAARAHGDERKPIDGLEPHIDDGAWREVILLTAGYLFEALAGKMGEDFLQSLKALALAQELNAADRCSRLNLAVQAAAEAPRGTVPEALVSELQKLAVDNFPNTAFPLEKRIELGLALGKLGDPRLGLENEQRWVRVAAGSFKMGSTDPQNRMDETWRKYCQPVHTVTLTRDFILGRYPVTNGEFAGFIDDGGYRNESLWHPAGWEWLNLTEVDQNAFFTKIRAKYNLQEEWKEFFLPGTEPKFWRDVKFNGPNQPVAGISWFEADAWCRWLTRQFHAGTLAAPHWWSASREVVLPTEAQWEFAARGTAGRFYPWGDDEISEERANYDQKLGFTSPVGSFPLGATAEPEAIHDLCGNVWEWCRDVWAEDAYQRRKDGARNPEITEGDTEGDSGDPDARVVRGGSWFSPAQYLAAPIRYWFRAWYRSGNFGFRCCVSVPPST